MSSERKFNAFLDVAKSLNSNLNTQPVLYGSLGLNQLIGETFDVYDIDVLIPDHLINDPGVCDLMSRLGYKTVAEHEFEKDGDRISYDKESGLGDIPNFSGTLDEISIGGAKFKQLTPQDYLNLYVFLRSCDWRVENGKPQAYETKIAAIQKHLQSTQFSLNPDNIE